jgi:hypothetical protein
MIKKIFNLLQTYLPFTIIYPLTGTKDHKDLDVAANVRFVGKIEIGHGISFTFISFSDNCSALGIRSMSICTGTLKSILNRLVVNIT